MDGSYQIPVTDTVAEVVTVTVKVDGVTLSSRPQLTFGPP